MGLRQIFLHHQFIIIESEFSILPFFYQLFSAIAQYRLFLAFRRSTSMYSHFQLWQTVDLLATNKYHDILPNLVQLFVIHLSHLHFRDEIEGNLTSLLTKVKNKLVATWNTAM